MVVATARAQRGLALHSQQRRLWTLTNGSGSKSSRHLIVKEGPHKGKHEPGFVPWIHHRLARRGEMSATDTWAMQEGHTDPDSYRDLASGHAGMFSNGVRAKAQKALIPYESRSGAVNANWDHHVPDKFYAPVGIEWDDYEVGDEHRYNQILDDSPEASYLHPHIIAALASMGVDKLTRSQVESLYAMRRGHDLMLASHPGTGKTSATCWHIINKLLKEYPNAPFSTVWLVPNENLAKQTLRQLVTLGKMAGIPDDNTFCLCVDSKDLQKNFEELMQHRPCVLVGTAERIGDLIHTPHSPLWEFEMNTLQRIIVDEVDAVAPAENPTALGFTILNNLILHRTWYTPWAKYPGVPQQKVFISATLGNTAQDALQPFYRERKGRRITNHYGKYGNRSHGSVSAPRNQGEMEHNAPDFRRLHDDGKNREVAIYGAMSLQKDIRHVAISAGTRNRWTVLAESVKKAFDRQNKRAQRELEETGRGIFFRGLVVIRNPADAKYAAHELYRMGFKGKVGRLENPVALESYANGSLPLLISTVDAVRGMDLPYLTHVHIACKVESPQEYVRVAGRVGRSGRSGVCTTVFLPNENRSLEEANQRLDLRLERFTDKSLTALSPKHEQKLLPEATWVESKHDSRETLISHATGAGTSLAKDSALIKSYLIDDSKSLNTLVETHDPYELQELDMKRNLVLEDGTVKPHVDTRKWIGGTTPGVFYSDKEKELIHESNTYTYMPTDQASPDMKSLTQAHGFVEMPTGSIHPNIAMRAIETQTNPRGVHEMPKSLQDRRSPAWDSKRIMNLCDAQTGRGLGSNRRPEVTLSDFPLMRDGERTRDAKRKEKRSLARDRSEHLTASHV